MLYYITFSLCLRDYTALLTWCYEKIHVTTARVQDEFHAALDQTRTLCVHVIDVQLPFIRKHAAPRCHTQIFYPTAGNSYHR